MLNFTLVVVVVVVVGGGVEGLVERGGDRGTSVVAVSFTEEGL